ncbi:MAG TPA: ATP-dependent zinc metalloprotease FtsH [Acidimicrobiales bacterium]|nr:ATP-dependent zinc metalloprotease FtsH [Acidimicrobiales bacterium]
MSLIARRQGRPLPLRHLSGSANPGPPKDRPRPPAPPPPPKWRTALLVVGLLITLVLLLRPMTTSNPPKNFTYTSFVNAVTANQVKTATIQPGGQVTGTLTSGVSYTSQIPTALNNNTLSTLLLAHKVQVTGTATGGTTLGGVLLSFLPLLFFVGFFVWIGRRSQKQLAGGIMGFGGSKAKVYDEERPSTRFSDVAGYESTKREISEVVDFLKRPERYRRAGAVGPKGVLMIGPPGTGKTLMARAVAGEADVPFFALTGSSFVEMFVGVGASRVRDLFADARKRAPSIVFIDEIDAIGGRRGTGFAVNDEREQTLNQLLAEMDGFDPTTGVVVLAATNRIESLDPALLRPGRFDRTVEIPLPNQAERSAILRVHSRGKKFGPDLDLDAVSRGTPGFSGADLANLVNEAAINAVREDREVITAADFDTARDRILLGHREATNALLPDEKHSVAVHESGHALVAVLSEHADPVAKVTILPAGRALGVTEQLPEAERHLYPQSYLTDALAVRLGGRAAEVLVIGEASTGAANDLAGATDLATRMVREWGLSDKVGPIGFSTEGPGRLSPIGLPMRPYAEDTQRLIDEEVTRLVREAETRATKLLSSHRAELDRVIALLLEKETVDGEELLRVVGIEHAHHGPEQTMAPSAAAVSASTADGQANVVSASAGDSQATPA